MKYLCLTLMLVFLLLLYVGCAPKGYIEGQTACELEVESLRSEIKDVREKHMSFHEYEEELDDSYE
jgi:hypothetical protein